MGRDSRRTRLLLVSLLVLALALITVDVVAGKNGGSVRRVADSVVGPVERAAAAGVRPIRDAFGGDAAKERKRAETLEQQNAALKRQLAAASEAKREEAQLSKLGLLATEGHYRMVPARVIATGDATGTERTVDLGSGSDSGLAVGQLVVNTDGLVGVIVRVSPTVCKVRLADDPRTVIGARLATSRVLGTISGTTSTSALAFTLYDPSLPVKAGEKVVTYGSDDYAGGIPVGVTAGAGDIGTSANGGAFTQSVKVRPYVKFGTLDLVSVVVSKGTS